MITILVTQYLPAMILKYVRENASAFEMVGRSYNREVPAFLRIKPSFFIKHCMEKTEIANFIDKCDIEFVQEGMFKVRSQTDSSGALVYTVLLNDGKGSPSCECRSWRWTLLPCKHIFAVLSKSKLTWEDFPYQYRKSPFFNLDTEVITFPHALCDVNYVNAEEDIKSGNEPKPVESSKQACSETPYDSLPSAKKGPKSLKGLAISCREKLSIINNATYLCNKEEALTKLSSLQDEAVNFINANLYTEGSLLQEEKSETRRKRKLVLESKSDISLTPYKERKCLRLKKKKKYLHLSTNNVNTPKNEDVIIEDVVDFPLKAIQETDVKERFLMDLESTSSSSLAKPERGKRYHVGGEVLEKEDFDTLEDDNWLNDKIINAFLSWLARDNNYKNASNHVFVMPLYMAVLWDVDRYEEWLYRKVKMASFSWLFLPVNVNNNHWVLLAADVVDHSVSVLDSLGGNNHGILKKWRHYMSIRSNIVGEMGFSWRNGDLMSSLQSDGSSCGLFTLMNAYAIINGIEPRELLTKHARLMRDFVYCKLLQSSSEPQSQRRICDFTTCKKPGLKKPWVCCDVCGRWCHFECLNIDNITSDDYVCPLCVACYG